MSQFVHESPADSGPAAFPWARFLPARELTAFARELREAVTSEAPERVEHVIHGWRATAEVYADPALLEALQAPLGDYGSVLEPHIAI